MSNEATKKWAEERHRQEEILQLLADNEFFSCSEALLQGC